MEGPMMMRYAKLRTVYVNT